MHLQQVVDDRIMEYLRSEMTNVNLHIQYDMEELARLEKKHELNASDEIGVKTVKYMIQESERFIVEYEQALKTPNNWISSQPEVDYILKHWRTRYSDADSFDKFQKNMRACAELFFRIVGLWKPLGADGRKRFLCFINEHLHEHVCKMQKHIYENRSVMKALYNLLGNIWDEFHNQPGKPFLTSRQYTRNTANITRGAVDYLRRSESMFHGGDWPPTTGPQRDDPFVR